MPPTARAPRRGGHTPVRTRQRTSAQVNSTGNACETVHRGVILPARALCPNPGQAALGPPPLEDLTPRELEVLGLLSQGKTNPAIAEDLVISRATVKVHVERIIRKLGVSDRTQAVVRAIELGLVKPELSR